MILLSENGKSSSDRQIHNLNVQFFFMTEKRQNKRGQGNICHAPDMLGDFLLKSLQGALFTRM